MVPDRQTFHALAREGNLIPVYREILADVDTPVSAFLKLRDSPYAFLLESVEGGERVGRWSFVGTQPSAVLTTHGQTWQVERHTTIESGELSDGEDPLCCLKSLMTAGHYVPHGDLPPFVGGGVGFMSYDLVRFFEELPTAPPDELNLPDVYFMLTDTMIAFDHVLNRAKVITMARVGADGPDAAYYEACAKIDAMVSRLRRPLVLPETPAPTDPLQVSSNFTHPDYEKLVARVKEYIAAGDIIQVVPSQRFSAQTTADPFDVYRALRSINPSPYMYFLQLNGTYICGSSPEILVTEHNGEVRTRPIAGTRRRGATPEEDDALRTELLADEKERAEHIMLVDLGRNDLGRVCDYGTVKVDQLMTIERYSHVMHIVSDVVGRLKEGRDQFDVLRACFPAGTLSGAPKIRAMEIINEVEPVRRSLYGGAIGYFGYNGSMDTCIAIRTALLRDGKCYWQAGGGVVADSDPAAEYDETCNKAMAIRRALEMAERGLE